MFAALWYLKSRDWWKHVACSYSTVGYICARSVCPAELWHLLFARSVCPAELCLYSVPEVSVLWNVGVHSLPELSVLWNLSVYSVPEVSVLWNFGVYSFSVVYHIWNTRTARAVFSNDACSDISKILHLLVIFLCIIVFTLITFSVNSLGLYRTWPRRLNHRWLLNNNKIQKWSRHSIWQLHLPHFVVHVTCARMQWMLKNRQGGRGPDMCGSGNWQMRSSCVSSKNHLGFTV